MSIAIKDVVDSPRAIKALADAGYQTLEDVEGVSIEELSRLKGVGDVTVAALRKAGELPEDAPIDEDAAWDEGPHPIVIESPRDNLAIRVTRASEKQVGRRWVPINPIFLRLENGVGRLTRELYLLAKHNGDKRAAKAELSTSEPWRLDAIEWLKAKPSYKTREFIILTD